jgi:hypothetical protein
MASTLRPGTTLLFADVLRWHDCGSVAGRALVVGGNCDDD